MSAATPWTVNELIGWDREIRSQGRPLVLDLVVAVPDDLFHARTKGSVEAKPRAGGAGYYLDATPEAKRWQGTVSDAVRARLNQAAPWVAIPRPTCVAGVLVVSVPHDDVTNRLVGDGDKHLRLCWDALTKGGLWEDDSQGQGWSEWKTTTPTWLKPHIHIMAWVL